MNTVKIITSLILILIFLLPGTAFAEGTNLTYFDDVPENHWAYKEIHDLRSLKITDGMGNNEFGMGLTIKRSEFVAFLVKLMKWEIFSPEQGSFIDNSDTTKWYYGPIETALKYGTINNDTKEFRPEDPITREEMAIMIMRTLDYDTLANQLHYLGNPFDDVYENPGYITIAKDFGIINGVGNNLFKPYDTARREEAAVMMMRMYNKLNTPIKELHAFYAIRSVHQSEMIRSLDSIGFGWSRLEYDFQNNQVILNTTRNNNNEYAIPLGFLQPFTLAEENNVSKQLMIFVKDDLIFNPDTELNISLVEYILVNPDIRKQVINSIVTKINNTTVDDTTVSFDGVVIDFENMRGDVLKRSFNEFLTELRIALDKNNNLLYVAVHPARRPGQAYYDGYDYKTIGNIADKVILMAHDYSAKQLTDAEMENGYTITPLTPIDEIYYTLKYATNKDTGIQDLNKLWVQFSFDSVQWQFKDGKVINKYPHTPDYESIQKRLIEDDVKLNYSKLNENPYATFFNNTNETENILWYEDSRSIEAKIRLLKMFDIQGISLWRLGNIPAYENSESKEIHLDVWQSILNSREIN